MTRFSRTPKARCRASWISVAIAVAFLCGKAATSKAGDESVPAVKAIVDPQMSRADLPLTDDSLLRTSILNRSPIRREPHERACHSSDWPVISLVSLESGPDDEPADNQQEPQTPIYTMQEPEFQPVDGNAYTGPSATTGTWVLIAPYGWIAGINGQVGIGNRVVNIDLTPGQVLSHLGSVDGALMLHAEVGKGDWGFILDGNLIRASTSVTTAPAQVDVSLQQTLIEALGMYRLLEASDVLVDGKSLTVDLLGGGRYYQFANGFTVHPFNPALPAIPAEITSSWVDMVLGGRARVPVTTSLDAFARADVGGFGIGSSSTLAWNVIAGLDWKMTSCSSLVIGYREMNINKFSGSGLTPFGFNAKLYGPFMAVAFQF